MNFKDLDDLIHSGAKEIVLDSDVILGDDEGSEYSKGIALDIDDLVIDGNGYKIDACDKARIFYCSANATIENLVFKNGYGGDYGGAIKNDFADLTIINSKLIRNTADKGGAIDNDGGNLCIIESTLAKNRANGDRIFDGGGAIHNSGGDLIAKKSIFKENAAKEGGAINHSCCELTMIESIFSQNRAENGGAVYNNGGRITIEESEFFENAADWGGAIDNSDGGLSVGNSAFSGNSANWGGAIRNNAGLTIRDCTLSQNMAEVDGAVIYNGQGFCKCFNCKMDNNSSKSIVYNEDFFQAFNSDVSNNQAIYAILNNAGESNVSLFYGEFVDNRFCESVIFNGGKSCTIEKSIFENNFSTLNVINSSDLILISPKIYDGSKILNDGHILVKEMSQNILDNIIGKGKVDVKGSLIPDDVQFDFGYLDGKIRQSPTKEVILDEDICFERYEQDFFEGGIELDINGLIIDGAGHTIDGAFKSRIFIVTGNDITLRNIIFKNGYAHKNYDNLDNSNGGAIKSNRIMNLSIENCKFHINTSESEGGSIFNEGELTIEKSSFSENTAKKGACAYNAGDLKVEKSSFCENSAKYGGAIYNDNNAVLTIIKSVFSKNSSKRDGGALTNGSGDLTIVESTFANNKSGSGGAIINYGALTVMNSTFNENSAILRGGAIKNSGGELTIFDTTLSDNEAEYGGAIFARDENALKLKECSFKNNKPNDKEYDNDLI